MKFTVNQILKLKKGNAKVLAVVEPTQVMDSELLRDEILTRLSTLSGELNEVFSMITSYTKETWVQLEYDNSIKVLLQSELIDEFSDDIKTKLLEDVNIIVYGDEVAHITCKRYELPLSVADYVILGGKRNE